MYSIRFYIIVGICALVVMGVTILIARMTKRKSVKYVPSFVFAAMAAGFFIKSVYYSQSMQDIAYMLMAVWAMVLLGVSLCTAILIGSRQK